MQNNRANNNNNNPQEKMYKINRTMKPYLTIILIGKYTTTLNSMSLSTLLNTDRQTQTKTD